jgi:dihydrofolate synthase/folylpolyglutamate synthase
MSEPAQSSDLTEALSRLDELTDWERRPRGSMRVGLEPMFDLMQRLGNPHESFRSIHVAGTKGKGSVCALVEAGLLRVGLRVGRYSSPHVERVTERVNILGQPADEAELARTLTRTLDGYEAAKRAQTPASDATWFDVLTAAAFLMFKEAKLDWAVVEVGIGGRLDSTNVVNADVAIVTNIELEHTEILGSTREAIASEKVGILKPGAVLATTLAADDAAGRVLQERADQLGCPVLRTNFSADATIEERNVQLVGLALDCLGGRGVNARSDQGAETSVGAWLLDGATRVRARLPGRLERREIIGLADPRRGSRVTSVVFDGAHIPFNLAAVIRDLNRQPGLSGPCVAIVALAGDKDAAGFLSELSRRATVAVFTELPVAGRGRSATDLAELATSLGITSEEEPDARRAFERGVQLASSAGAWVLVTGSLYLVGALRGLAAVAITSSGYPMSKSVALQNS